MNDTSADGGVPAGGTEETLAVCCRGVTKRFESEGGAEVWALRGIDLSVPRGGITMLVGPSGCGKTTLISVIAGILSPDAGSCEVLGANLNDLSTARRLDFRAHNIGFIFQQFHLLPSLTIADNVGVPLLINDIPRSRARAQAKAILEQVGLANRSRDLPGVLSGGEQQRVAIARALVHAPQLVVCDEPTSALDHDTGTLIMDLIMTMVRDQGTTVLIVTHDNRIFPFADRIARMDDGRIVGIDIAADDERRPH
ncbi:MAG: ABC transporter ATP-binding protein [Rhodospirillales bacterium]|nr:ABC transporter ATP-binding protein [Rhodospirillales bacterium]